MPVSAWNLAHASLFFCSLPVLVWACAAGRRGAWLALTGQALSQGLRMVIAVTALGSQPISFALRAMQYAKLFNLPFLLCGMWIISCKFAEQSTQAERLSAQLEEANRGLEQKVEQRTRAMRQQQARRQAFMTNAFHDLRTPLFVVQGCLDQLGTGEEQDKVFLRYYRAPGAKRRGSSGLGLSIAREIVVQHQGRITLASRPGAGAAFTIRLPAVTRPAKGS